MTPVAAPRPSSLSRARFGPLLLALSLALAACRPGPESAGERFTFTFRPPDGTDFIQHLKSQRIQEFITTGAETETQRQTHESESATRFTIQKTETGYQIRAEQVSTLMTRDGEPVEDPVSDLLRAMPATYVTDPEGKLMGIRGFEKVSDRIATELPSELSSLLTTVITEEALVERGTDEWNGRYGDFAGRTIEIGDILASSERTEFSGDVSAIQYTATWFPETVECDGKVCVRVRTFRGTDLQALKEWLAAEIGERAAGLFDDVAEAPTPEGFESSGETNRVVDPATLLAREETQRRTVTRQVPISDQISGVLMIIETKRYAFAYAPGPELRAQGP